MVDGHDVDAAAAATTRERDRLAELESEVASLQDQLAAAQARPEPPANLPRWRWRIENLLADRAWWDEWLPRLGELMGRHLQHDRAYGSRQARPVVDDRGFADVLTYLFPDLRDEHDALARWYSPEYPRLARLTWESQRTSTQQRPIRAEVWEPVVRHVALALTALEASGTDPHDAYTHLRVEAEIRGEWLRTLGVLLGEGMAARPSQLPRDELP